MVINLLKSTWRPHPTTLPEPSQPKVSNSTSEKIYECCWDLAVHGTLLSLMNIVTFVSINFFKSRPLPLKRGVVQAVVMTGTYLASVEGLNYRHGKNMRKSSLSYVSRDQAKALWGTIILTPILTYGYEKFLMNRKISFFSTVGLSFLNGFVLLMAPHI